MSPRLDEVRLTWLVVAVTAVEIWLTYARLPAAELYHVSGRGFWAGASRVLVFLNFPVALMSIAVVLVLFDRLPSRGLRALGLAAIALCAVVIWPGVVRESNLDARAINALPAAGVGVALGLTFLVGRLQRAPFSRADGVRLGLAALLLLLALPWLAAEAGFFLNGVPLAGWIFQTGPLHARHSGSGPLPAAVHHGHHHGMDGVLLAWCSLLLSRTLPRLQRSRPRLLLSVWLALMLAYGLFNMANDAWTEQVVKRGWTAWQVPDVLVPSVGWGWGVLIAGAAAVWLVAYRPRPPQPSAT